MSACALTPACPGAWSAACHSGGHAAETGVGHAAPIGLRHPGATGLTSDRARRGSDLRLEIVIARAGDLDLRELADLELAAPRDAHHAVDLRCIALAARDGSVPVDGVYQHDQGVLNAVDAFAQYLSQLGASGNPAEASKLLDSCLTQINDIETRFSQRHDILEGIRE